MKVIISMLLSLYFMAFAASWSPLAHSMPAQGMVIADQSELNVPDDLPSIIGIVQSHPEPKEYLWELTDCSINALKETLTTESSGKEMPATRVRAATSCWMLLNGNTKPLCFDSEYRVLLYLLETTVYRAYLNQMCDIEF